MQAQPSRPDVRAILVRVLLLLLAGTATSAAITQEIMPVLLFLAGSGSGIVASYLYEHLSTNQALTRMIAVLAFGNRLERILSTVLTVLFRSSRTAALVVFAIGALLATLATGAIALASGQPLSAVWSAMLAFAISQVVFLIDRQTRGNYTAS